MYVLVWRHLKTGRTQRGPLPLPSRELAESAAKTLNRARPGFEYWVESVEEASLERPDSLREGFPA
jgi:hypothetical protein